MKIFGQELVVLQNQIQALYMNIWAWFITTLSLRRKAILPPPGSNCCVSISGPGGLDKLELVDLGDSVVTVGCNLKELGFIPPYVKLNRSLPLQEQLHPSLVLVEVDFFSVNYADVCIRWGLYESALRFVGWPITPGFDFSGRIVWAGDDAFPQKDGASVKFAQGDAVFGFSLFGSYSRFLLVPARQIRLSPRKAFAAEEPNYGQDELAGVPAAAATALHAIALARAWPQPLRTKNKACLIHSAGGGVGSQLIQMCKLCGFGPVVAVVGSSHKIDFCKQLGAYFVI
jgi:D-arabinose 1-dehydrogenase-like Zn-dependent alcohol dehydrogenase